MKIKLLLLLLCFFVETSNAQDKKSLPTYRGHSNCAEWLKPTGPISDFGNKFWLSGYLSGINLGLYLDKQRPAFDFFENVSSEQIFLWMDNYCRANPLSNVVDGTGTLFREMQKK